MSKIYEFFGISKPSGWNSGWESRMQSSISSGAPVYDRYDLSRGLHAEPKKEEEEKI